jgi:hypothetical protein
MNGKKSSKDALTGDLELKPVPIQASVCLCKNNFDYFNWQNIRHLRTKDCDAEIKAETLGNCEDRITTVEFLGLTSYTNIKTLLHRCSNLKSLALTNVLLNHYETDYKRFYIIEATELQQLTLSGNDKLSKDEMHILDFFFRRVRFASLKSVTFQYISKKRLDDKKKSKLALRNNFTKTSVNAASVTNFLTQNRSTLQSLHVRRSGVPLFKIKFESGNEPEAEHLKLSLKIFECDPAVLGFDNILSSQNSLEILTCASKKSTPAGSLDSIANTVRRCADSLKEIHIVQIVGAENGDDGIQHDCAMYKFCNKLEYLRLHVTMPEQIFDGGTDAKKRCGAILNLRFLPLSLTHLILQFDYISQHGVELFVNRIPKMTNLKFLVFHGHPLNPFKLKSSWVIVLLEHPSVEIFEFSNCKIEDPENILAILNSRPELSECLKVSTEGCFFWRGSSTQDRNRHKSNIINNND